MVRRVLSLVVLALAALVSSVSGQSERRVTISTTKGDVVVGPLRALSADEVAIEVAGQSIRIPLSEVKYLSFVGEIAPSLPGATSAETPLQAALRSAKSMRAASQVGLLREQYSAKLVETMPAVQAFIAEDDKRWINVKAALVALAANYQAPMADLQSWNLASTYMGRAARWLAYADDLSTRPGEETATGIEETKPLNQSDAVTGRLMIGDAQMDRSLDASSVGGLNDRFTIEVPTYSTLEILMTCAPCDPHLTLVDPKGKKVDGDAGSGGTSKLSKKNLSPGTYTIWAGTYARQVGDYKLTPTISR